MINETKIYNEYLPDPEPEMLETIAFNAVWNVIKSWDISTDGGKLYSGATGNHVRAVVMALSRPTLYAPDRFQRGMRARLANWLINLGWYLASTSGR